jgi:hypothetical protein
MKRSALRLLKVNILQSPFEHFLNQHLRYSRPVKLILCVIIYLKTMFSVFVSVSGYRSISRVRTERPRAKTVTVFSTSPALCLSVCLPAVPQTLYLLHVKLKIISSAKNRSSSGTHRLCPIVSCQPAAGLIQLCFFPVAILSASD